MELGCCAGEFGPVVKDRGGCWARAALELGFDGPGEGRAVEFGEDLVCADCVEVFAVEEEAVHVEEAGADWGWHFGGWLGGLVWFGGEEGFQVDVRVCCFC